MSIELVVIETKRHQVAAYDVASQKLLTRGSGREIIVDGPERSAGEYVDLVIHLRKPKGERAYDTGRAEAKKIHAWMIFNLPSSTYKALAQLLREIE